MRILSHSIKCLSLVFIHSVLRKHSSLFLFVALHSDLRYIVCRHVKVSVRLMLALLLNLEYLFKQRLIVKWLRRKFTQIPSHNDQDVSKASALN